jgi:hypothetical protein
LFIITEESAMTYTLRLLSLECVQSQELDGDEAYLTLNGDKVWSAGRARMSHDLAHAHRCNLVDFASGRLQTDEGWVAILTSRRDPFVFARLSGEAALQLWDDDRLTRDDLLGETPISETDIGRGPISVLFTRDGASYRLTYQVDGE